MQTKNNHLLEWLSDPKAAEYFGAAFCLKSDVLALMLSGEGSISAIAKKHGVTRQAAHAQAKRALKIYTNQSK